MGLRGTSKKGRVGRMRSRTSTVGRRSIVVCQNVLLWMSLYVAASTAYILILRAVNVNDIPSVVLCLLASTLSLSYLLLQNTTTHLRVCARNMTQYERVDTLQVLATHALRLLVTIWMIACGLTITFTAARTPLCASSNGTSKTSASPLDVGRTCIINRVTILTSLIAFIASSILFILLHKVNEPYRCHLFGIVKEHKLLPLFLPHKQKQCYATPSEMSFKCRSSTSLASQTARQPPTESTAYLIASAPEQPYGLGIYTGRSSAPPSLLRPRPSLSSIQSHTSLYLPPPPSSPLPPLPAYIPKQHHAPNSLHRAIYPPKRPYRPGDSVRIARPAPALNSQNLHILNRSESISSVYSRSTSGESRRSMELTPVARRSMSSRTTSSSSSTSTLKPSPLGIMTLAEQPEAVVVSLRKTVLVDAKPRSQRCFSSSASTKTKVTATKTRTFSDSGVENVKPRNLDQCFSMRSGNRMDSRLKGYVESQNRIREQSVKITPPFVHERKDSGAGEMF
ncbi:hypothetical protein AC578_6746 [Pseudocercospora eumusae]|uniref:Uncharacterized protein n=1 Tax=Pseudocercospora eumusae TaxID=321146 RepID=A0A139HA65_9PEZI|nr:hypothetical protein AC578_6746 [Pseudocercospora eumusae]